MPFGSVRFFKNLIIGTISLILLLISVLIFNSFHYILYSTGTENPDKSALSPSVKERSFENLSNSYEIGMETTTNNGTRVVVSDIKKPYQLLFPDLYGNESSEAIIQNKTVYLTFDDGPSQQTLDILKILSENNVKATFFVIGKTDETSRTIMKQIVDEGHTIGVHSYTHNYEKIYTSVDAYLDDFNNMNNLIYEATGIHPSIFRFPGGSINSYNDGTYKDIIEEMSRRGFTYYDWNVSSLDTLSDATVASINSNVVDEVSKHSRSIVLFHDSDGKIQTVNSLDGIIKDLKDYGYTVDSLTNKIKPIIFKHK